MRAVEEVEVSSQETISLRVYGTCRPSFMSRSPAEASIMVRRRSPAVELGKLSDLCFSQCIILKEQKLEDCASWMSRKSQSAKWETWCVAHPYVPSSSNPFASGHTRDPSTVRKPASPRKPSYNSIRSKSCGSDLGG